MPPAGWDNWQQYENGEPKDMFLCEKGQGLLNSSEEGYDEWRSNYVPSHPTGESRQENPRHLQPSGESHNGIFPVWRASHRLLWTAESTSVFVSTTSIAQEFLCSDASVISPLSLYKSVCPFPLVRMSSLFKPSPTFIWSFYPEGSDAGGIRTFLENLQRLFMLPTFARVGQRRGSQPVMYSTKWFGFFWFRTRANNFLYNGPNILGFDSSAATTWLCYNMKQQWSNMNQQVKECMAMF